MNRLLENVLLILVLPILFSPSCNPDEPDPCDALKVETFLFQNFQTNSPPDKPENSRLENGKIIYYWSTDEIAGICPKKAIRIRADIQFNDDPIVVPDARVGVDYAFFFEEEVAFIDTFVFPNSIIRHYEDDIDIGAAFDPEPASGKVFFEIIIPTSGSAFEDSVRLFDAWKSTSISVDYYSLEM